MDRKIILSQDGSHTMYVPGLDEHYHSRNGAIMESEIIYIKNGLSFLSLDKIAIFEVGFGTGLNAFLSMLFARQNKVGIRYTAIEKYPLIPEGMDGFKLLSDERRRKGF